MDLRELKALELAARANIVFVNGYWIVPSQSTARIQEAHLFFIPAVCDLIDAAVTAHP